jgi:mxaJ protein
LQDCRIAGSEDTTFLQSFSAILPAILQFCNPAILLGGIVNRIYKRITAALIVAYAAMLGTVSTQSKSLRICGDPDNLPFSNEKLEGFENKIAAVIAAELGATPSYAWWPHQRGLVRNTIDAGTCDVIFGIPEGLDFVLWTKPYYRSSYVIAYRKDRGYRITSLDAPELKQLRFGVYANTPPEESLARRGFLNNVSPYSLFFDPRGDRDRPLKLLADLVDGTVDIAIPWGPLAGYYAKKLDAPLELVPLQDDAGVPLSFDISMGVKKGNNELKSQLEAALDRRRAEIRTILEEYGVPLLPQTPQPAPGVSQPAGDALPPPAADPVIKKLNPFTGNADMIAEGKKLYFQVGCQGCHGGGGGGGMAASVIDDIWKFGSDDESLFKLIKGQIPQQLMPTVYNALPDDDVWKMLAFIRSVYAGDPTKINWAN